MPPEFLGGGRKCYYPLCESAPVQYEPPEYECPAVNLTTCIQHVDVNATDATIGNVTIKQTAECGDFKKKDGSSGGGSGGNGSPECSSTSDCPPDYTCVSGSCKPEESSDNTIWIVMGVLVGIGILVALFVFLRSLKKATGTDTLTGK